MELLTSHSVAIAHLTERVLRVMWYSIAEASGPTYVTLLRNLPPAPTPTICFDPPTYFYRN